MVGRLTADGQVLEDTFAKGRPALFTFGSRPLPSGLCVGVEEALASMRAGKRTFLCKLSELCVPSF